MEGEREQFMGKERKERIKREVKIYVDALKVKKYTEIQQRRKRKRNRGRKGTVYGRGEKRGNKKRSKNRY